MSRRVAKRRKLTKAPIGDMGERISLERRSTVPANAGEYAPTIAFVLVAEVWAKADLPQDVRSGRDMYNTVDASEDIDMVFTIRYRNDISTHDIVIKWRSEYYEILPFKSPDGRNCILEIPAKLRGSDTKGANQ